MTPIKHYLLKRWGYYRLEQELQRTKEALEASRAFGLILSRRISLYEEQVEYINRDRADLIGRVSRLHAKKVSLEQELARFQHWPHKNSVFVVKPQGTQRITRGISWKRFQKMIKSISVMR